MQIWPDISTSQLPQIYSHDPATLLSSVKYYEQYDNFICTLFTTYESTHIKWNLCLSIVKKKKCYKHSNMSQNLFRIAVQREGVSSFKCYVTHRSSNGSALNTNSNFTDLVLSFQKVFSICQIKSDDWSISIVTNVWHHKETI